MRFKLIALLLIIAVFIVDKTNLMSEIILLHQIDLRGCVDAVGVEAHDEAVDVAVSVPNVLSIIIESPESAWPMVDTIKASPNLDSSANVGDDI